MGDDSEHSLLSASGFPRTIRCYGSLALGGTVPNVGSKYAAQGTAGHGLGAYLLSGAPNKEITRDLLNDLARAGKARDCAADFIGETITADGIDFVVDQDFADNVQRYVDYVCSLGGMRFVEVKVNYANWLGVAEDLAWGTSDAIVIHDGEHSVDIPGEDGGFTAHRHMMTVVDLKFGAGVAVYPDHNEQGMLYAGGALNMVSDFVDLEDDDAIEIVIHQPRIGEGEPQSWFITVGDLKRWLKVEAAMAAQHALKLWNEMQALQSAGALDRDVGMQRIVQALTPGEKQCRFCSAKAICPAVTNMALTTISDQFVDLEAEAPAKALAAVIPDVKALSDADLDKRMKMIPLIEGVLKSWRAETEARLYSGSYEGEYGLFQGRQGNRVWKDPAAAAKVLQRNFGAAEAFSKEPISPAEAEKVNKRLKATKQDQERVWKTLEKYITRAPGGVTVKLKAEGGTPYSLPNPEANFAPVEDEVIAFDETVIADENTMTASLDEPDAASELA